MKGRKKTKQQITEDRNALYHKVILHNQKLGEKNTELSIKINTLENKIYRKHWWEFWKPQFGVKYTLKT